MGSSPCIAIFQTTNSELEAPKLVLGSITKFFAVVDELVKSPPFQGGHPEGSNPFHSIVKKVMLRSSSG